MTSNNLKKMVVAAMFVALAVALSAFSIPVGASRCFPVQHMVNVLSAVLLGPFWGAAVAFCASAIRNFMGTGTLLAFPGSMVGALCCGLMYHYTKRLIPTYLSEILGTGVLGGLIAYPIASMVLGRAGAVFMYVIPFLISTAGGTLIAAVLIWWLEKTKALSFMKTSLGE